MTHPVELDRSLPVLIVKIGHYPLHPGGLGAIRSLGRLGVPVHAVVEDRFTPAALSRHLRGVVVWPTSGREAPEDLVAELLAIGSRLERRAVILPTDDEAAVLIAEYADDLAERFVFPPVPAGLPRRLADKDGLHQLCRTHSVPTPASSVPASVDDLMSQAARIGYPVVLKNARPWARLRLPAVGSSTVIHDEDELRTLAQAWPTMPHVLVQEYLPSDRAQDWVVGAYSHASGCQAFTGMKVRSWPAHAGVTSRAYAAPNEHLTELTSRFCRAIDYRGIADLDWRFDRLDGQYKLLDFNPRVGSQFRLFETEEEIDVVRSLHLDMSGRPVPEGRQLYRRSLQVENLDIPAVVAYRRNGVRRPSGVPRGRTERAWLAMDDMVPAAAAAVRSGRPAAALLTRLGGRVARGRKTSTPRSLFRWMERVV